jgi:alkanesulfonate monooxygenase SsuD/methylene tetrahydromethanopterin reductase-like flavin-dependent oxidoreductase (luciferase family)
VKTGVILPIFQPTAALAFDVALDADRQGVDGVFCYDHLWPMGQPERPALAPFPVLGAVATRTRRVRLGTLVARVGLVPDAVLRSQFDALEAIAPGRVIAGLGTGDRLSQAENDAYGIAARGPQDRRDSLRRLVRELKADGATCWIGTGRADTARIAEEERVALNMWGASPQSVAEWARHGEVTWAGPTPLDPDGHPDLTALEDLATALAQAGATWMVLAWPTPLAALVAMVGRL